MSATLKKTWTIQMRVLLLWDCRNGSGHIALRGRVRRKNQAATLPNS